MSHHNLEALKSCVLEHSASKAWPQACTEWRLLYIYVKRGGQCVCEHRPITNHCVISNLETGHKLVVGNTCVQRFGGELADLSKSVFASLKKIELHPEEQRANEPLIKLCRKLGILNASGASMYIESWQKRTTLTVKQVEWIVSMNKAILIAFAHTPRTCASCTQLVFAKLSKNNGTIYYRCDRCNIFVNK
eukprot:c7730_g2_i1.p1 GENE.c7730_g2_i1~~c7730_g2_i1.p1  ORF type:complete len:191 (+),score=19.87 c7730_g2_i1:95-667(+)